MKAKKQNKTKIGVGSFVKAKFGELENITGGGEKQEYKEGGGGMCPGCVISEEFPIPILIYSEERDKVFFACDFKFERGG